MVVSLPYHTFGTAGSLGAASYVVFVPMLVQSVSSRSGCSFMFFMSKDELILQSEICQIKANLPEMFVNVSEQLLTQLNIFFLFIFTKAIGNLHF